jgi:hypothetical protein
MFGYKKIFSVPPHPLVFIESVITFYVKTCFKTLKLRVVKYCTIKDVM